MEDYSRLKEQLFELKVRLDFVEREKEALKGEMIVKDQEIMH